MASALALGLGLALIVLLGWLVFVQRGANYMWNAACRVVARAIHRTLGLVLVPEYLLTTLRRKRAKAPGRIALATSQMAEPLLDGAESLHKRHPPLEIVWKSPPWRLCGVILLGSIALWGIAEYSHARKMRGTNGADRIIAGPEDDLITGKDGRDYLDGGGGADTLIGGAGNDRLAGAAADDRLSGNSGRDLFFGGPGNDRINARDRSATGRRRADTVRCGSGQSDLALVDRRDKVAGDCERIDSR